MSLPVPSGYKSILSSMILTCLVSLLCFPVLPQTLTAQVSTTGKIAGTVTDSSGAAVPGAAVSVKSDALLAARSTHTEADGSYLFDLLPPGSYELTVTAAGFRTQSQTGIVLTAGFTATVNSKMQVGEVTQVVKVEGGPVIDLQNNQTSMTFDQILLQEIPRSEEHTSELQSLTNLVCRLLL